MKINILSFNMCHGQGLDGIIDLDRQAQLLRKYNPDIIFLQEIDMYTLRANKENQLQILCDKLNMKNSFMGVNIRHKDGYYGSGVISNYPIIFSTNYLMHSINIDYEKRGIAHSKIQLPNGKKINAFSIHLSTIKEERIIAIKDLLKVYTELSKDEEVIVAGDFNIGIDKIGKHKYVQNREDEELEYKMLQENLMKLPNNDITWYSKEDKACIDTMFYSKGLKLLEHKTIQNDASDHALLYAQYEIQES